MYILRYSFVTVYSILFVVNIEFRTETQLLKSSNSDIVSLSSCIHCLGKVFGHLVLRG